MATRRISKLPLSLALLIVVAPLLACAGGNAVISNSSPSWACPSPLPKPWGERGPVKEQIPLPTAVPEGPQEYENVYYKEWEQEYPTPGLDMYPSPTPYGIVGTNYVFGQRVRVGALFVTMTARAAQMVDQPGTPANTLQLYLVDVTWVNQGSTAIPFDYRSQIRLRAVTRPDSRIVTDSTWGVTPTSERMSNLTLPATISPGTNAPVVVPIIGPAGTPKIVELEYAIDPSYVPPSAGTPAVTPVAATPTPNDDLRRTSQQRTIVQWTNAESEVPGAPPCSDPGALTDWGNAPGVAWGHDVPVSGVAAPAGAQRVVQIAMNQVGKRYVWGAAGPETFDCSGLMQWSYGQIGINIPRGTGRGMGGGQWELLRPVDRDHLQMGDMVYFNIEGKGVADHVGMLVGDVNGDGKWDMVHAASPALGIRMVYDVFGSSYYIPKIMGFRTAR